MKRPDDAIEKFTRAIKYVQKFDEKFVVLTLKEVVPVGLWFKHLEAENAALKKELEENKKGLRKYIELLESF